VAKASEADAPRPPRDFTVPLQQEGRVRELLGRLAPSPPQVLLLEGGDPLSREGLARYWACSLNCEALSHPGGAGPCLECHACKQMLQDTHRDLFFFDGAAASIKIDEVRELRRVLGEPPRDARYRMVILFEAQALGAEAANALLKSLEDPRPNTRFVLCAPQRERLLPTLVSRSWVVTLAWADPLAREPAPELAEWLDALAGCVRDGRGWMARTAAKGALDRPLAQRVCLEVQRELLQSLLHSRNGSAAPGSQLSSLLAGRLSPAGLRQLDEALAQCLLALDHQANAALVLDWLAVTLYRLVRN